MRGCGCSPNTNKCLSTRAVGVRMSFYSQFSSVLGPGLRVRREVYVPAQVDRRVVVVEGNLGQAQHGPVSRNLQREVPLLVGLGHRGIEEPSSEFVPDAFDLTRLEEIESCRSVQVPMRLNDYVCDLASLLGELPGVDQKKPSILLVLGVSLLSERAFGSFFRFLAPLRSVRPKAAKRSDQVVEQLLILQAELRILDEYEDAHRDHRDYQNVCVPRGPKENEDDHGDDTEGDERDWAGYEMGLEVRHLVHPPNTLLHQDRGSGGTSSLPAVSEGVSGDSRASEEPTGASNSRRRSANMAASCCSRSKAVSRRRISSARRASS